MKVQALVRDRVILIDCGDGYQRVKWLAMVATQRYDDMLAVHDGSFGDVARKHVPVGLEDDAGRRIPPTKTVNRLQIAEGETNPRVRVLLLDDAAYRAGSKKNGTSAFLTAIAAVPEMCTVAGAGLTSCTPRVHAGFTVYCRDNFGMPIRNGGEDLSVALTSEAGAVMKAEVTDHNDGTYAVTYALPKRGAYTVDITIDGDHVVGSPFECVATDSTLPPTFKWMRPSYVNGAAPPADEVEPSTLRALVASPTDLLLLGQHLQLAWTLHTPNLRFSQLRLKGQFPPPAPQAPSDRSEYACCLLGKRLFLHGGATLEIAEAESHFIAERYAQPEDGGPPGDGSQGEADHHMDNTLWVLDIEAHSWSTPAVKGSAPPALCGHSLSAHSSKLYLFGGRAGRSHLAHAYGDLYVFSTTTSTWDKLAAVPAPGHSVPMPRWGHTLTPVGSRLFVFGGQTGGVHANWGGGGGGGGSGGGAREHGSESGTPPLSVLGSLYVFDLGTREWSVPTLTGPRPRPRRGHSATLWGKHLVIALGTGADAAADGGAEGGEGEGAHAAPGGATSASAAGGGSILNEVALVEFGTMYSKIRQTAGVEAERLSSSTHASSAARTGHSLCVQGKQLVLMFGDGHEPSTLPQVYTPLGHMMLQDDGIEVVVPQPGAKLPGNYTIEAWVCTAATQPMSILCKTTSAGPKAEWSHQLRLTAEGRVEHALSLNHGETHMVCVSSAKLHQNHWYYIVGTLVIGGRDESEADFLFLRVYVNGVKEDEEIDDKASQHSSAHLDRFVIGCETGGGFGPFIGAIGDVSVWDHALVPESIANTWVNRNTPDLHDTHLLGHWKLNEGHSPAAIEASTTIVSTASPPVFDIARTNTMHVYDHSIYTNQGVVVGNPRCTATTVPLYFDARKQQQEKGGE